MSDRFRLNLDGLPSSKAASARRAVVCKKAAATLDSLPGTVLSEAVECPGCGALVVAFDRKRCHLCDAKLEVPR